MEQMHGTHNMPLVGLSFIIAFMAALAALDLARRVNFSKGWRRKAWLLSGSTAMGIGIWAMHFIAMLAFKLPVAIHYNLSLVTASIIVAIAAFLCGLSFICQSTMTILKLFTGGMFMGIGIGGMHYIGMAAMQGIHITYNPYLFVLSVMIAIGASIIALMLAFRFRESEKGMSNRAKFISGIVMAIAITGMHYTGMAAAKFMPDSHGSVMAASSYMDVNTIAITVTISAVVILGLILVSSFILDQRLGEEIAFKGAILESVLDCVIIIDHNGDIIECNPSVERTFGYSRRELIGQNMEKILFLPLDNAAPPNLIVQKDTELLEKRIERTGMRKSRKEFPAEMTITRIKKEGLPVYTVYVRDIAELKKAEETIRHMAYHDTLTGLPNRRMFNLHLKEALNKAEELHTEVAVAYIDLDRFKIINDSLGHTFGDLLLCTVAERLRACLGEKDVVSRNGGDEFTITLTETSEKEVENVAKKIIDSLIQPIDLQVHNAYITTSIGIAMYPRDGDDYETLIKKADVAMYETKARGRNGFSFFQEKTDLMMPHKLQLENELRRALDRNEFVVYYQPQLNIHTNQIIGAEALIRWDHPERGVIQPNDFIPLAEETGLIVPIGNWVLHTAVAQFKKWHKEFPSLQLSVNLSTLQLKHPSIVQMISDILNREDFNPTLLNLEITESIAMDGDYCIDVLKDLKKIGIKISMDDFGTGYSSLSGLQKMPIDQVKIDKSFMKNMGQDLDDAAIVEAIILMAKSLNMNVIAEGVEDEWQLSFLKKQQCHDMQGFLFSPPIPAETFETLVSKSITRTSMATYSKR